MWNIIHSVSPNSNLIPGSVTESLGSSQRSLCLSEVVLSWINNTDTIILITQEFTAKETFVKNSYKTN